MKIENCKTFNSRCRGCGKENDKGMRLEFDDMSGQMFNFCEDCRRDLIDFLLPPKKEFDFSKSKECKWWYMSKGEGCRLKGSDECAG